MLQFRQKEKQPGVLGQFNKLIEMRDFQSITIDVYWLTEFVNSIIKDVSEIKF